MTCTGMTCPLSAANLESASSNLWADGERGWLVPGAASGAVPCSHPRDGITALALEPLVQEPVSGTGRFRSGAGSPGTAQHCCLTAGPTMLPSCLWLLSHLHFLYFKGTFSMKCFGACPREDCCLSTANKLVPLWVPVGWGSTWLRSQHRDLLPVLTAGTWAQAPRLWGCAGAARAALPSRASSGGSHGNSPDLWLLSQHSFSHTPSRL